MTAVNARHSAATPRWGTPPEWVAMARSALGGRIELDPMSEPRFNRVVGAERFRTKRDGLPVNLHDWACETMLINPAGGFVREAWAALDTAHRNGIVKRAIWIGFSVEQLAILADDVVHPLDYSLLICRKRIAFLHHRRKGAASPSHSNYVVGLGVAVSDFERAFAGRGRFHHGRLAVHTERADHAQDRAAA